MRILTRILTALAMLLASFMPALGATTWPAGTNTANQTFFGNNNFLGNLQQNGVAVLTNAPSYVVTNSDTRTINIVGPLQQNGVPVLTNAPSMTNTPSLNGANTFTGTNTFTNPIIGTNGVVSFSRNRVAPVAISVTASPFNFTNSAAGGTGGTNNLTVFVDGSGVTGSVAVNGTTVFSALAGADATIPLQPNEYVTVTYSLGTPVMKWKPF